MAKKKIIFVCSDCGSEAPRWAGQCADCGAWNTIAEQVAPSAPAGKASGGRFAGYAGETGVLSLANVNLDEESRISTGLSELDRVLGGGLMTGAVVLLGGDPGIGKSTLLLQALTNLSKELPILYVTGEESLRQVSLRAKRLGLDANELQLLTETSIERILDIAQTTKPACIAIDSVQTMYSEALTSAPGSVGQVRETTAQVVRYAKQTGTSVFLVGHVTKEGTIAGPRVLEHMVDCVLNFESDTGARYRLIRAQKNRFGAVNELGVFAMTDTGLKEITNPSAIFLSRADEETPGSLVMATREGSRPLLVEVQALVDQSPLGNPRRITVGLEQNRLAMLLAVLHRHAGIAMFDQDVYVNVVGGVRISETGSDLPVLLSVMSSFKDRCIPSNWLVFGEVGLAGEIRPVQGGEERLREAAKQGFKLAIVPKQNAPTKKRSIEGLEVVAVSHLREALERVF